MIKYKLIKGADLPAMLKGIGVNGMTEVDPANEAINGMLFALAEEVVQLRKEAEQHRLNHDGRIGM